MAAGTLQAPWHEMRHMEGLSVASRGLTHILTLWLPRWEQTRGGKKEPQSSGRRGPWCLAGGHGLTVRCAGTLVVPGWGSSPAGCGLLWCWEGGGERGAGRSPSKCKDGVSVNRVEARGEAVLEGRWDLEDSGLGLRLRCVGG